MRLRFSKILMAETTFNVFYGVRGWHFGQNQIFWPIRFSRIRWRHYDVITYIMTLSYRSAKSKKYIMWPLDRYHLARRTFLSHFWSLETSQEALMTSQWRHEHWKQQYNAEILLIILYYKLTWFCWRRGQFLYWISSCSNFVSYQQLHHNAKLVAKFQ